MIAIALLSLFIGVLGVGLMGMEIDGINHTTPWVTPLFGIFCIILGYLLHA